MFPPIDNHVLFPHVANFTTRPSRKRSWLTGISETVTGHQSRFALRAQPRLSLTFTLTPRTLQEQAQLEDRILAAKKSGLACAPFWGRASVLQSDCTTNAVVLQSAFWPWKVGNWIGLFRRDAGSTLSDTLSEA